MGNSSSCRKKSCRPTKASKILIIGGTGYIGKFIVEASARSGHPTFALVRETTVTSKPDLIDGFNKSGVTILYGDLNDHESLLKAIRQVDVVISTVGGTQLGDQSKIIAAIKEAGNVKRFLPSEFGNDVDRTGAVPPAKLIFGAKSQIRREIEAAGIPYTFVTAGFFAGYFLPTLGSQSPPTDKITIMGDGNTKAIFVSEEDIGTYTMRAVDDPRTLNKILYLRPPANILSHNQLISLWEKKTGKTLKRIYLPEEEILNQIQGAPMPANIVLSISHAVFVKGDHTNFEIDPKIGGEATKLYPDVKYATIDELLNRFI